MPTMIEERFTKCLCGCDRNVAQPVTGRPRRYFNDRCKERARRSRERARDDFSRGGSRVGSPGVVGTPSVSGDEQAAECRVCGRAPASVGPPGNPILCQGCAAA